MVQTAYLSHSQAQATHANRGNVAIIVWNTLEAPYVWDVTNTEYEGTINLGNSTRSLLSIYFRDFVAEYENEKGEVVAKYLKEAEYVEVTAVPSTDGELGENQFTLVKTDDTSKTAYAALLDNIAENKKPRGTDADEWTTADGDEITAYAPAFDDLDTYFGKIVTVIFGKDNEVVSIRVIDETVDNEYLTAYKDSKLKIGGNSYKFADDARVYINTKEMTAEAVTEKHSKDCTGCTGGNRCTGYSAAVVEVDADAAMTAIEGIINVDFSEKYNKVIKANVVLNTKGKVSRLDLLVSGDYPEIDTYEAVVEKVRSEVIKLDNNEEIDYSEDGDYADEDDQPRVIKDGTVVGLEEIEAGDVLTYYQKDKVITTIYASSKRVSGELTRASKKDFKLTVEGEAYYSSMEELYVTKDKISDAEKESNAEAYIGEDVELYLNVYGEYVLVASEKANENWVFGIVTKVDKEATEDEDDNNIFYRNIRVLLADGTTARNYKFVYDTDEKYNNEYDIDTLDAFDGDKFSDLIKNELIIFAPDANGEITVDDFEVIKIDSSVTKEAELTNGDYRVVFADGNEYDENGVASPEGTAEIDDDRERIDGKIFGSETVIFNLGGSDDPETSTSWKMLVTSGTNGKVLAQDAMLIYEENAKTLSYVLIDVSEEEYATSDAEYAIVLKDDYKEKRTSVKKFTELLTLNGTEEYELKGDATTLNMEDKIIEFALSGSKVNEAGWLIDLPEFESLKADDDVLVGTHIQNGYETKLVADLEGVNRDLKVSGTVKSNNTEYVGNGKPFPTVSADVTGLYFYEIEVPAGNITIKQENNALAPWDGNTSDELEQVGGKWIKTKSYDMPANTTLAIPLKANEKVKITITGAGAELVYNIDTTALVVASAGEAEAEITEEVTATTKKANFKVVDTQKLLLEYEDDEDDVTYTLGEVVVDEDVIVIDARDGKLVETTFSALRDEVKADGYVYVIPFANEDAEGYSKTSFDVNDVEANILVIVD